MCSTALHPLRAGDKFAARILKAIKELSMTFGVVRVASFQKYHPRPDDLRCSAKISKISLSTVHTPHLKPYNVPVVQKIISKQGRKSYPFLDDGLLGAQYHRYNAYKKILDSYAGVVALQ
ncbi:hypothetical protein L2E82_02895 [Cichorium intybus]|uniref:Uncharacterized protein n=1 Tax=Cichorium intybus TaxID=13427 RepID=A0ACB9H3H5_CICIN|nr:hypothetical protein L2E82_02895 [Cichorium intybus]